MRRALVLVLALLLPASAGAVDRAVMIHGKLFEPGTLTVLVGESVSWTNHDSVHHDVEADDGSFDSGDLKPGGTFSATFARPGRVTYLCTIHRFMRGEVEVFALALSGPRRAIPAGGQAVLRGIGPAGQPIAIERRTAGGAFETVATVNAAADGTFRVAVPADAPRDYRATLGALASPSVRVLVSTRLTLAVRRVQDGVEARVSASPTQPHAPFVVQLYARERFTWVSVIRGRLDSASRARVELSLRRGHHLRAALVRGVGGYAPGTSNVIVVRSHDRRP